MSSLFVTHEVYQRLREFVGYKASTFRRVYKVKNVLYHPDAGEKEYEIVFKDNQASSLFILRWL